MNSRSGALVLSLFLLVAGGLVGWCHPLDISYTQLQIEPWGVRGTTYVHPYELALLAAENDMEMESLRAEQIRTLIEPYFRDRFRLYARSGAVGLDEIALGDTDLATILAGGLHVLFTARVPDTAYPLTFRVTLFTEFFTTQTNKLLFRDASGELYPTGREIILTARRSEWSFDPSNPDFSSEADDLTDTDGDGLSDRFEGLYGMNPESADTDGDGYTDFVEFTFGWDPFDPAPTKGQSREVVDNALRVTGSFPASPPPAPPASEQSEGSEEVVAQAPAQAVNLMEQNPVEDRALTSSRFLERTLRRMQDVFDSERGVDGLMVLLLSVFALGFFHGAMPGHGKGVMASYLAGGQRSLGQALVFISIFTATHLVDVVLLGVGVTVLAATVDTARISTVLKTVGGVGLVSVGVVMVGLGIRQAIRPEAQSRTPRRRSGGVAVLGFLTGLAPCPFGWALLMMLLSLNRVGWVPVIIAVFGLGIFVFLLIMALVIAVGRHVVTDLFKGIERYAQLISGVLLLVFGLLLFTPRIPSL